MFGTELRRLRLKAGLTQEEVSARANVTREYVSMLEAGKNSPTIEVFIRLVRAVGASPAEVIAEVERQLRRTQVRHSARERGSCRGCDS